METDCAWAAGVFDGEGCVFIARFLPSVNNKYKKPYYSLYTAIDMTHKPTLERFVNICGETKIYIEKGKQTKNPNHKTRWNIRYSGDRACSMLKKMLPYLTTKKDETLIALEFMNMKHSIGTITTETNEQCEKYYRLLQDMKKMEYCT